MDACAPCQLERVQSSHSDASALLLTLTLFSACLTLYAAVLVSVANNDLQPEGCRILLGAVSFHPTLTALDISSNMLSLFNDKQGYLALSYVLQFARNLCWLNISDNPLPTHAVPVLREALAANTSLTCLFARDCSVRREQLVDMESSKRLGALERLWYT